MLSVSVAYYSQSLTQIEQRHLMLKNAINWFEIPVTDLPRAIEFYEHMLQSTFQAASMDGIDMAIFPYDEGAVSGALVKAPFLSPSESGSVVYLNANGILDTAIERAVGKGAKVIIPKTHIGDPGYIAHIIDSEGNKIGLHSISE